MEFTEENIFDRDLILQMLKYENTLYFSKEGQNILSNVGMKNMIKFDGVRTIQRLTLKHFNFSATDESLNTYRKIFFHYYKNSIFYDFEIMESIVYFRENRCLYYNSPILNIGDIIPDCNVLSLNKEKINIKSLLQENKNTLLCAFSSS